MKAEIAFLALTVLLFGLIIVSGLGGVWVYQLAGALTAIAPLAFFIGRFERGLGGARVIAFLACIVAANVALRQAVHGTGVSPVFFIVILTGYVFGGLQGFIAGALTMAVSNFFVGGHGPWSIAQMTGLGLVGYFAGFMPKKTGKERMLILLVYGVLSAYFYGLLTDIFSWAFFVSEHSLETYIAVAGAGMVFNTMMAAGNFLFILFMAEPVLRVFERFNRRLSVTFMDGLG
jgi:hypothetical protein